MGRLSIDVKIFRKIDVQEKSYGTFIGNFWGDPKSQGVPEPAKVQGESLEGVVVYKTVKRSQLYLRRNSRYKGSKFDLLGPLAAKQ